MSQIPRPYQAVQQQAERRSALRAAGFPHLGLLAAQQLFGIFESIFDTPARIKRFGYMLLGHVGICSEKEVVRLFTLGIAHDQQLDRCAATHAVPRNDACVDEPLDYSSALIDGDSFLVAHMWCGGLGRGQAMSFFCGVVRVDLGVSSA